MYGRQSTLTFFNPALPKPETDYLQNTNRNARLYIISGPSGAGKTTIIEALLTDIPNLEKIITFTTRKIRPGEIPGKTYHYITRDEFESKLKRNEFLEHLEFSNNLYGFGLTKAEVLAKIEAGTDLIVDLDYSQIADLKAKIPDSFAFFIMPPSTDLLKSRLTKRGDAAETIERRMQYAQTIIDHANASDVIITNEENKLADAVNEIKTIIKLHRENKLGLRCGL